MSLPTRIGNPLEWSRVDRALLPAPCEDKGEIRAKGIADPVRVFEVITR